MKTEKEKMLSGEWYNGFDELLVKERMHTRLLLREFNDHNPADTVTRKQLLKKLIPSQGDNLWIEPPFQCDYGTNITTGDNVFFNFNCVILDVMQVTIGSNVLLGPSVQIYTPLHPMDFKVRASGLESGKPVRIGNDCWIGGGAIICPGVTIGARTVIGAGSVVTRDIPEDVFAAGNPCRVIRSLVS
jgi:maltose O-acetyltransferase